jgi:hypothetical protein
MNTQAPAQLKEQERTLLRILRTLPNEKAAQIVDYARFVQSQTLPDLYQLDEDISEEEIIADEERWDAQFAASPNELSKLVQQAKEEIQKGQTTEIILTDDGRMIPG